MQEHDCAIFYEKAHRKVHSMTIRSIYLLNNEVVSQHPTVQKSIIVVHQAGLKEGLSSLETKLTLNDLLQNVMMSLFTNITDFLQEMQNASSGNLFSIYS